MEKVYELIMDLYSDFPAFKYIEKEDFMDIFGSYKYILDYDMVKIAFYKEEVVGFFISVPNYANLPYKLNVRNFFKILRFPPFFSSFLMPCSGGHLPSAV